MYSVGDYVVHPGQGVCHIRAVTEKPEAQYELVSLEQRNAVHLSYPVSQEERLRPIVSKDQAQILIEQYSELEPTHFDARSTALEEQHYKQTIRHGSCKDSMRIVKTFSERIQEMVKDNKKPPVCYERILKRAQERSFSELAVALGCSMQDITVLLSEN